MKGAFLFMKLTLEQKMKMCEEHIIKGKSISHASEMYGGYDIYAGCYYYNAPSEKTLKKIGFTLTNLICRVDAF